MWTAHGVLLISGFVALVLWSRSYWAHHFTSGAFDSYRASAASQSARLAGRAGTDYRASDNLPSYTRTVLVTALPVRCSL